MLDTAIIPILQALYTILHSIAAIFWWIDQAILLVGFYITALTDWLVNTAMSPLISSVSNQTMGLLAPVFVLAMTVLGITYLLAVFGTIQIVSMRSAILWLLFAAFIYQVGPQMYQGTERFRRGLGGLFYEQGIEALSSASSDISALSQIGTSDEALMAAPANAAAAADDKSATTPEAREFNRLERGFHLPPQQAQALVQQVAATGSIGSQLGGSIRSHLAALPTRSGTPLSAANINRVVQALERAAERMASATSGETESEALDTQVTSGKPSVTTSTTPPATHGKGD